MYSRSERGAAARAVALAIAAALTGAPQVIASALDHDHEHRCQCPAGTHRCSCPRCASKARDASGAGTPKCHGAGAARPDAPRPPCHGTVASETTLGSVEAKAPARLPAGAACVSPSCHDRGPESLAAAEQEPFVPASRLAPLAPTACAEAVESPASLAGQGRAAPEPPPPRA